MNKWFNNSIENAYFLIVFCVYVLVVFIWRHQRYVYESYNQFAPNFDMAYKTIQHVFVSDVKLFGSLNKNKVIGRKTWRIFYVIWESGVVGVLLPTSMAAAI